MAMSKPRDSVNLFALTGQEEDRDNMHWDDMPEFVQPKKEAPFTVNVRFRNYEDMCEFADLIGQPQLKAASKRGTKSTWHPRLERGEGGMDATLMWAESDEE